MKQLEIERKYICDDTKIEDAIKDIEPFVISQGYIETVDGITVRVRVRDKQGFITIKNKKSDISCDEYEYEIDFKEAQHMINHLTSNVVYKRRYIVPYRGQRFEVDFFPDHNFYLAELELHSEDDIVNLPDWVTKEVSGKKEYYNYFINDFLYNRKPYPFKIPK